MTGGVVDRSSCCIKIIIMIIIKWDIRAEIMMTILSPAARRH